MRKPCKELTLSSTGSALIKHFEGLRTTAYQCEADVWTIGWGHTRGVTPGMTITHQQAIEFFNKDIAPCIAAVRLLVKVPLTQAEFDVLVSFVFNLGEGKFASSTLLKFLNKGQYDAIPEQLMRWTRAGKNVSKGLVRRRTAESLMWRGVRDLNFDGKPDASGSRTVTVDDPVPEKDIKKSGTLGAGIGGAAISVGTAAAEIANEVQSQADNWQTVINLFSKPSVIVLVGCAVLFGVIAWRRYSKWREAGV